jgi:hypothetical protein
MNCIGQRSNQHHWGLNRTNPTPQRQTLQISPNTKWTKLLLVGKARRSILQDSIQCVLHIKSEVKLHGSCKFYVVLLHKGSCFDTYHSIRNYETFCMQFLQEWVPEYHLYSQIASKNIFRRGCTSVKCPGNWRYLTKRPSSRQCVKNHINPSAWSVEYTRMPCTSYAVECRIHSQYTVLFSFIYNMKSFGDIFIFVIFCTHWNGLNLQVTNFVPSPFLQLLLNTVLVNSFCETNMVTL